MPDMTFIKIQTLLASCTLMCVALFSNSAAVAQERPQQLPTTHIGAGMHNIVAQVAHTPEQRQIGLMYRKEMAVHEGMLFVFERPAVQCFWMKNTLLPLTAAFLADDGTIVNLENMEPQSLDSHCSRRAVRFVLEMNQGWFAKRGLHAGAKLSGPAFLPSSPGQ